MIYIIDIDENNFGISNKGSGLADIEESFPRRYASRVVDPMRDGVGTVTIRDKDTGAVIIRERSTEVNVNGQVFTTGKSLVESLNGVIGVAQENLWTADRTNITVDTMIFTADKY